MGWALGFVDGRDVGYGVPAWCELPGCNKKIDRGISFSCGGIPGNEYGCGLFFCEDHLRYTPLDPEDTEHEGETVPVCDPCAYRLKHPDDDWKTWPDAYPEKPDHPEWLKWKLTDDSWQEWRKENPDKVKEMESRVYEQSNAAD
jgi:hypothetical protein